MNRIVKSLKATAIGLLISTVAMGQVTQNATRRAPQKAPKPQSELQAANQVQKNTSQKPESKNSAKVNMLFSEDFSSGAMPANFTLYNQDGLTPASSVSYVNKAWIANPNIQDSTDYTALSTSWYSPTGAADDWMVLPKISNIPAGAILKWNAIAYDPSYADGYQILISTTDSLVSSFTDTIFDLTAEQSLWTNRSLSLNAYAGQDIFIAFRNNSYDKYLLAIDDIEVYQPDPYEIGVTNIKRPTNDSGCVMTTNEEVEVNIENFGSDSVYNFDVSYILDNGTPVTETITDTLLPGHSMDYIFTNTADLSAYQTYHLKSYTTLAQDTMNQNDTAYTTVMSADAKIKIKIHTDDYPSETSWELYNSNNQIVASSPVYAASDSIHITEICAMSSGCYSFKIMDSWGDGLLSPGGYEVYFNNTLVDSSYSFNSSEAYVYHIGNGCASNDLEVKQIYTLGKLPKDAGTPHHVGAVVRNAGTAAQNNAEVYLDITGANTFQDTITLSNINSLETDTITFGAFNPANLGLNNVNISLVSDQNNSNNSMDYRQELTTDTYNYADTSAIDQGIGFNDAAGMLVARYELNGTYSLKATRVNVSGSTAGNQLYGVVLDSAGNILSTGNPVNISASDTNTYVTLPFTPFTAKDQDIYVGVAQIANANDGYFPLNTQVEDPGRKNSFFYVSGLNGGSLTESANMGRWMIEGVIMDAISKDAVIAGISTIETGCNLSYKDLEIQIYNNGVDTIKTIEASYTVNGGSATTDTIDMNINPGDTLYYTFQDSIDASSFGAYNIHASLNLQQDTIPVNDTASAKFYNVEPSNIPYTTGFEPGDDNYAWYFIDGNNDGNVPQAMEVGTSAAHGGKNIIYVPAGSSKQDEYVISTCLNLEAGKTYQLRYWHRAGSFFGQPIPEDVQIMIGTNPDPSSMTDMIADLGSVDETSFTKDAHNFQVNSDGVYYIAFHITTDGGYYYLLDDLDISDVTSINEKMTSGFNVYPNPTDNMLNVKGETNIQQVSVYNTMGQLMHNESVNATDVQLNVADYDAGVYIVRMITDKGLVKKKFTVH